jgi:hypothetical protein
MNSFPILRGFSLATALSAALCACSSGGGEGTGAASTTPACEAVAGTAAVTFTLDDGATLAPAAGALAENTGAYSVVVLDQPGWVLASVMGEILRSKDAGCTWTSIGKLDAIDLVAAPGGRAFARGGNDELARIDGATIQSLPAPQAASGSIGIVGLGADPADGEHVRLLDKEGNLWESKDGGLSWAMRATVPAEDLEHFTGIAFDPADFDHVIVAVEGPGVATSHDGGLSWTNATGFAGDVANMFAVAVSPADGRTVWAAGLVFTGTGSADNTVWRSTDGGLSFSLAFTETGDVELNNGADLVPHPTSVDDLYLLSMGRVFHFQQGTGQAKAWAGQTTMVTDLAFPHGDASVCYAALAGPIVQD